MVYYCIRDWMWFFLPVHVLFCTMCSGMATFCESGVPHRFWPELHTQLLPGCGKGGPDRGMVSSLVTSHM